MLAFDGDYNQAIEEVFANEQALPSAGMNTLSLRVQDSNEQWGPTFSVIVEVGEELISTGVSVSLAEYFWNDDPGVGNGTTLLAFDGDYNQAIESFVNDLIFSRCVEPHL